MENQFFSINEINCINNKNYFEKIYDSKEVSNIWHRAVIVYKVSEKGWLNILIKASDEKEELDKQEQWDSYFNPIDISLYKYKGRYLKLIIEHSDENFQFNYMRIYYSAHTFIKYLPDIYQKSEYYFNNLSKNSINKEFNIYNTFFFRFVALFQNIYLDMDNTISSIPEIMDPIKTNKENLDIIAKWLNIAEFSFFSEDIKRRFLMEYMSLYQKLGTRYALMKVLNLITNQKIGIVEFGLIINVHNLQKYIRHIFKNNKHQFIILLVNRNIDENQKKQILSIVNYFKPAHTKAKVVYLQEIVCLNYNSYLGINSRISAKLNSFNYNLFIGINSVLTEKKCNILNYTYLGINSVISELLTPLKGRSFH